MSILSLTVKLGLLLVMVLVNAKGQCVVLLGLWPFNQRFGVLDVSGNGNHGNASNILYSSGRKAGQTAVEFKGVNTSFVELLSNKHSLNFKNSFTFLMNLKPEEDGRIFDYIGPGTPRSPFHHFYVESNSQYKIQSRFNSSDGRTSFQLITPKRTWVNIGLQYNHITGQMHGFIDGEFIRSGNLGKNKPLMTEGNVRVGVKKGGSEYFKGKISCIQLYNSLLPFSVVQSLQYRCDNMH